MDRPCFHLPISVSKYFYVTFGNPNGVHEGCFKIHGGIQAEMLNQTVHQNVLESPGRVTQDTVVPENGAN